MPGMFSININGMPEMMKAVEHIGGIEKHRPALNQLIHGKMKMQVRETFDKERDPVTGQKWKPVQGYGHAPKHKILQSNAGAGLIGSLMAAPLVTSGDEIYLGPPDSIAYANVHQFGATIRPKSAKNLAIPMSKSAARAGSARRWWGQQGANQPFIYRAKTGKKNLFIAQQMPNGKLELHWLLVKMVNVPQRRYLGWGKEQTEGIQDLVLTRIKVIARNAGFQEGK